MRAITRINNELQRAGRPERLRRNLLGGSYYYLSGGVECSIYCYSLDETPEDYDGAVATINNSFRWSEVRPVFQLPYFSDIIKRDFRAREDARARRELRARLRDKGLRV